MLCIHNTVRWFWPQRVITNADIVFTENAFVADEKKKAFRPPHYITFVWFTDTGLTLSKKQAKVTRTQKSQGDIWVELIELLRWLLC